MPEWFGNLFFIIITIVMILFLGILALAVIVGTWVSVREWLEDRKVRKRG